MSLLNELGREIWNVLEWYNAVPTKLNLIAMICSFLKNKMSGILRIVTENKIIIFVIHSNQKIASNDLKSS